MKDRNEALFALCEKKRRADICVEIEDKSAEFVIEAMYKIKDMFGDGCPGS